MMVTLGGRKMSLSHDEGDVTGVDKVFWDFVGWSTHGLPIITEGFHNGRKTRKKEGEVIKEGEMGILSTSQDAQRTKADSPLELPERTNITNTPTLVPQDTFSSSDFQNCKAMHLACLKQWSLWVGSIGDLSLLGLRKVAALHVACG